jgi:hypothetical protein
VDVLVLALLGSNIENLGFNILKFNFISCKKEKRKKKKEKRKKKKKIKVFFFG